MTKITDDDELFATGIAQGSGAPSIAASAVVHCAVCGLLLFGVERMPRILPSSRTETYPVRILETESIRDTETLKKPLAIPHPGTSATDSSPANLAPHTSDAGMHGGRTTPYSSEPAQAHAEIASVTTETAPQTLVEPHVPRNTVVPPPRIPTVVLWAEDTSLSKRITASPPAPVVHVAQPSFRPPNHEVAVFDIAIDATIAPVPLSPVPATTTAPIATSSSTGEARPQTTMTTKETAAASSVVSLSELHSAAGPLVVPPANIIRSAPIGDGSQTADDRSAHAEGMGKGSGSGSAEGAHRGAAQGSIAEGSGQMTAHTIGGNGHGGPHAGQQAESGNAFAANSPGTLDGMGTTHLTRPKDGQFGIVVTGGSLADEYPETTDVWHGRLMYSVYLPMAEGKSWILQYAIPAAAQTSGVGRPDAPWPYDMVRPDLAPSDSDADAIMVHGLVTAAGRLEQLAVVFPNHLAQEKLVLAALQQWQFRPSRQNGKPAAVEVLLIIPEQQP